MIGLIVHDDENVEDSRRRKQKMSSKTLIVCPASLIGHWQEEIEQHVVRGKLTVHKFHGPNRTMTIRGESSAVVVITTYSIVTKEYQKRVSKKIISFYFVAFQRPLKCQFRWWHTNYHFLYFRFVSRSHLYLAHIGVEWYLTKPMKSGMLIL